MSNPKIIAAAQRLFSSIHTFAKKLTRAMVLWLLRHLLRLERRPQTARGFILPTTVLLLVLLTLTVGAITLRTYNRTSQAVGERQQRVIYNAASPALDRAKAKLEFMFTRERDTRFPSGIPGQISMSGMLINDGLEHNGITIGQLLIPDNNGNDIDPYTFPDEKEAAQWLVNEGRADAADVIDIDGNGPDRLDLDGDGSADNAWAFRSDTDGDGVDDATVAYSIIMMRPLRADEDNPDPLESASDDAIAARAANLEIRHGPLSMNTTADPACSFGGEDTGEGPGKGWFVDPAVSSILRKNFQVDVFVLPDDNSNTVSTLEFHQDRRMDQGNKWGAWFRNDLEVFPGPQFNWNGAMHTEGNLIVGNNSFHGYLISSPASCVYSRSASEVTIADQPASVEEGLPPFQAQFMSGKTGSNQFENSNRFHIYHDTNPITGGDDTKFNKAGDSVKDGTSKKLIDFTLDPLALMTQNVSKARGFDCDTDADGNLDIDSCESPDAERYGNWVDRKLNSEGRLYNRSEPAPYVDDAFRADNRYGPGARVSGKRIPGNIGEPIEGNQLNTGDRKVTDDELIRDTPPDTDQERTEVGLDGYWDRRARDFGLRILVGERLELGNAHGWGNGINGKDGKFEKDYENEPLMPWDGGDSNSNNRYHEARQRRALYDNLAAVQATVFYHANQPEDPPYHEDADHLDVPMACMASAVHPGSSESLILSSAFHDYKAGIDAYLKDTATTYQTNPVVSNFLLGIGTNGWEYTATPDNINSESEFGAAINDDTSPLGAALRNLAYFAGDPKAGTPSFEPVDNTVDNDVHPYPLMSMWGDFSVLRRVLAQVDDLAAAEGNPMEGVDADVKYDELSPADKATLHAAACTIGMLAYNIGFLDAFDYSKADTDGALAALEAKLDALSGNGAPPDVRDGINNEAPEAYIASLKQWNLKDSAEVPSDMVALAETILLKDQVERDRRWGFIGGQSLNAEDENDAVFPFTGPHESLKKLTTDQPKFAALRYLFPGDWRSTNNFPDGVLDDSDNVPEGELEVGGVFVRDTKVVALNTIGGSEVDYQPIDLTDETVLADLVVHPVPMSEWVLPHRDADTGDTNLSNAADGIMIGCLDDGLCSSNPGSKVLALEEVGFKDTVIFNGREVLPARSMDLNLDLLRTWTTDLAFDTWLPRKGIIYAFREDAVREDEITRPTAIAGTAAQAWNTCGSDKVFADPTEEPDCYMNAGNVDAFDSKDPPLFSVNKISPKPVDYYPDPDRRPHGFRLRNGQKLTRANDEGRGLSFITDNPVYIMGDFNLHQTTTCNGAENCRLEEFGTKLQDNFNNFYTRNDLNADFARPETDLWRPTEILADAITVISERYCDGSASDVLHKATTGKDKIEGDDGGYRFVGNDLRTQYNCSSNGKRTSFLNIPAPNNKPDDKALVFNKYDGTNSTKLEVRWHHANPYDALLYREDWKDRLRVRAPITPVVWSRNGNPFRFNNQPDNYTGGYRKLSDGKQLIGGAKNRVNAIIISGLTPSRAGQAYGGLHNFPRFIENWNTLYISGSLLQLSFSRYATAPFSQNSWEAGTAPSGGEQIKYYSPPNRRWGYDVGLQYAPAGPLASRFINISTSPRSEYYSEPPADDPYIVLLCNQIAEDPDTQCAE